MYIIITIIYFSCINHENHCGVCAMVPVIVIAATARSCIHTLELGSSSQHQSRAIDGGGCVTTVFRAVCLMAARRWPHAHSDGNVKIRRGPYFYNAATSPPSPTPTRFPFHGEFLCDPRRLRNLARSIWAAVCVRACAGFASPSAKKPKNRCYTFTLYVLYSVS